MAGWRSLARAALFTPVQFHDVWRFSPGSVEAPSPSGLQSPALRRRHREISHQRAPNARRPRAGCLLPGAPQTTPGGARPPGSGAPLPALLSLSLRLSLLGGGGGELSRLEVWVRRGDRFPCFLVFSLPLRWSGQGLFMRASGNSMAHPRPVPFCVCDSYRSSSPRNGNVKKNIIRITKIFVRELGDSGLGRYDLISKRD